jgi:hypothetical protein
VKNFNEAQAESDFQNRKSGVALAVHNQVYELIGAAPRTPETQVRIAAAIDAQARAMQLADITGDTGPHNHIDDLLDWLREGHNSPAEKCVAELTRLLKMYVEKVAAFEANVPLPLDNPNYLENFDRAVRRVVEDALEHRAEVCRKLWTAEGKAGVA